VSSFTRGRGMFKEGIMECRCKYFNWVNGELVCSQCGKSAHTRSQAPIEDKAESIPENKKLVKKKR
jgi:uncharacterized Zn finger protein (UPF0148 family)